MNVWIFFMKKEIEDAIKQGEKDIVKKGIVIAIRNDGIVVRRGIGIPPWKEIIPKFKQTSK